MLRMLILFLIGITVYGRSHGSLGSIKQELSQEEQALIAYEFAHNPNATMYTVFIREFSRDYQAWRNDPKKFMKLPVQVLRWIMQVLMEMFQDLKYAASWIMTSILKPLQGLTDIYQFFQGLIDGLIVLSKLIMKDWRRGLLNFFGGVLFLILHHSAEFTAQTILVLAAGFKIISPLSELIKSSVQLSGATGLTAQAVKNFCQVFFWIVHAIDDPLIILSSVLPAITAGTTDVQELNLKDPIVAQKFVQEEILGLDSPVTYATISKQELLTAFISFKSFICRNTTRKIEINNEIVDFTDQCSD